MIYSFYIAYWIKMTLLVCSCGSESIEVGKADGIERVNCAIGNLIKFFFFNFTAQAFRPSEIGKCSQHIF